MRAVPELVEAPAFASASSITQAAIPGAALPARTCWGYWFDIWVCNNRRSMIEGILPNDMIR